MKRAKIVKELREFLPRLFIYSEDDYMADLKALIGQAAAALEGEDKDARRYQRLRAHAIRTWQERRQSVMYMALTAPFHLPPRYGQQELSSEEADEHFDHTLDAWIENESKDG